MRKYSVPTFLWVTLSGKWSSPGRGRMESMLSGVWAGSGLWLKSVPGVQSIKFSVTVGFGAGRRPWYLNKVHTVYLNACRFLNLGLNYVFRYRDFIQNMSRNVWDPEDFSFGYPDIGISRFLLNNLRKRNLKTPHDFLFTWRCLVSWKRRRLRLLSRHPKELYPVPSEAFGGYSNTL